MATVNREFFIAQFREEASDHIQRITQKLFQLEEHPEEQKSLIEEVFRIAHTLKGSSRMMGYSGISKLAHKMEDLFVEIRDGHLRLQSIVTDLLFYCLDTINYLLEGLYKNVKRTADIEHIVLLFDALLDGQSIEVPHVPLDVITSTRREPLPKPVKPEPISDDTEERQYIRIHTGELDTILNLVGEVLINQYRYDGQLTTFQKIFQQFQQHRHQLLTLQETLNNGRHSNPAIELPPGSIFEQLEQNSLRLLRESRKLIKQIRTDRQQMHLAIDNLQEHIIDIRMVPASRIFHLLPRLVRMTARSLGKTVSVTLSGQDTRIDSRIIEEMRDPLMHLIQNAIRHGIESPQKRQAQGKDPTGSITVSAGQEGNRIFIRVKDDGQGIDTIQIKEMAVKTGLISKDDAQTIKEQELYEFLFQSGFSTVDRVDDIAGRGFGLDIVRDHVDRVQGEIEVQSQLGQGTEFVLKLPLTLTIMNALLVRISNQIFAIPTTAVEKTFDIHPHSIDHLAKLPTVIIDDVLLPVIELQKILRFTNRHTIHQTKNSQPTAALQENSLQTVIVIRSEEHRIGFIVDDLVEEREIVIKHLGPCLKRVRNIGGATTLREDTIIILFVRDLIHSADAILGESIAETLLLEAHARPLESTPLNRPLPRILFVDDSLNTRELGRSFLENAGYSVDTADNGVNGLEKLQQFPFDLVITDVEMPEMDGLQMLQQMRRTEVMRDIPVIVVSAHHTDEDKQKSLKAGAVTHIVKDDLNEQTLLHAVQSYLKS